MCTITFLTINTLTSLLLANFTFPMYDSWCYIKVTQVLGIKRLHKHISGVTKMNQRGSGESAGLNLEREGVLKPDPCH